MPNFVNVVTMSENGMRNDQKPLFSMSLEFWINWYKKKTVRSGQFSFLFIYAFQNKSLFRDADHRSRLGKVLDGQIRIGHHESIGNHQIPLADGV